MSEFVQVEIKVSLAIKKFNLHRIGGIFRVWTQVLQEVTQATTGYLTHCLDCSTRLQFWQSRMRKSYKVRVLKFLKLNVL